MARIRCPANSSISSCVCMIGAVCNPRYVNRGGEYLDPKLYQSLPEYRSIDLPLVISPFASQLKSWFNLTITHKHLRNVLGNCGSVLESMTGSATYQPDIVRIRMTVYQEVSIRSVFILTDACLS